MARQLESVLSEHLVGLCDSESIYCPGPTSGCSSHIDSLCARVYGHANRAAHNGHSKIRPSKANPAQGTVAVWPPRAAPGRRTGDRPGMAATPGKAVGKGAGGVMIAQAIARPMTRGSGQDNVAR